MSRAKQKPKPEGISINPSLAPFLLFFATAAIAGPFGLNQGMTLREIREQGAFVLTDQRFMYEASKINHGHPDFESYTAILTPEQGLCRIQALSKVIATDSSGTQLEEQFSHLVATLSEQYGEPTKYLDHLREGSIWQDPQDWMMGLLQKDRILGAYWSKSKNNQLADSINVITVQTWAISGNSAFLRLGYEFDNFNACVKVLRTRAYAN